MDNYEKIIRAHAAVSLDQHDLPLFGAPLQVPQIIIFTNTIQYVSGLFCVAKLYITKLQIMRLQDKFPVTHNYLIINLNRAARGNDIYMDARIPISPRKLRIRIPKRY